MSKIIDAEFRPVPRFADRVKSAYTFVMDSFLGGPLMVLTAIFVGYFVMLTFCVLTGKLSDFLLSL